MPRQRWFRTDELFPKRKGADGMPLCRYCGNVLPRRRRAWCSDRCMEEANIRCNPGFAAMKVRERDRGICAQCGIDTSEMTKLLTNARKRSHAWMKALDDQFWRRGFPRWRIRRLWDVHHIRPVTEGNSGCGLDNLQTLCVPCHKKHTAEARRWKAELACMPEQLRLF